MALANNEKPKYAITPISGVGILNAASAGTPGVDVNGSEIITAGANGARVTCLTFNSTDTAAVNVLLYILDDQEVKPLGLINVPALSGTSNGALNVDGLDPTVLKGLPIDNSGKRYIPLASNEQLKMSALANMTALKKLWGTAIGANY